MSFVAIGEFEQSGMICVSFFDKQGDKLPSSQVEMTPLDAVQIAAILQHKAHAMMHAKKPARTN